MLMRTRSLITCRETPPVAAASVNLGKDVRLGRGGGGPVVVCEVGAKFGAWKPGLPSNPLLSAALGQGERLVKSVEALSFWLSGGGKGGGGGAGGGGDGGGGGGGGGDGEVEILGYGEEEEESPSSSSSEERALSSLGSLDGEREYLCAGVQVINMEGMSLDSDYAPYEVLGFTVGARYKKADITDAKALLLATGWYKSVDIRWMQDSPDAIKLVVLTEDAVYGHLSSLQTVNAPLLPNGVVDMMEERLTKRSLREVQERVERWYHDQGYVCAKVTGFRSSEADGALECYVDEGFVRSVSVACEGGACHTNKDIILDSLPRAVRPGMQFNAEAGSAAVKKVEQLGLFDRVSILAAPCDGGADSEPGVALNVVVKESPHQSADVSTEWSVLTNDAGRPNLSTLQPGASVCVQHRNINGLNRTVSGSVATSNLLRPEDDLRFRLEYIHPNLEIPHPRLQKLENLTLHLLAFNKRKLSATYYDADFHKEVPAIWIDRAGLKASIVEKLSGQSKVAYGVVLEEVATRDDVGTICKQRGFGDASTSGSGVDHLAFVQMKITRSNLKSGKTGLIGARDIFQVDQGVGLGTRSPMFNRHLLAMTRYLQLRKDTPKGQLPSVIVLHSRYGGCLGDVTNYRSFSNGGPYFLRGNNIGELASFSRFVEVAGEVRIPVSQQMEAYGFVDSLTSLHNFGALCSSPGRVADRIGKGLMYGAGIKMGELRVEYVIECSDQTGSLKVYTGERY